MKKSLWILLLLTLSLTLLFSSCQPNESDDITDQNIADNTNDSNTDESEKNEDNTVEHTHEYGDWVEVTPPSCVDDGVEQCKCSCGDTVERAIPAHGHTESDWLTKDGPALTAGIKYTECTVCFTKMQEETLPLAESEGLEFCSYENGTCYVKSRGSCTDSVIVIPSVSPAGDSVIAVGMYAFKNDTALTGIVIPEGVTSIRGGAFDYCTNLTDISLPDSLNLINGRIFENCTSLNKYETDDAYYLGNATNPYVVLHSAKDTRITSFSLNSGTRIIYESAFSCFYSLERVTLNGKLYQCMNDAFACCFALKRIEISALSYWESIYIMDESFDSTPLGGDADLYLNGEPLTEITLSEGLKTIGKYAFAGCKSLEKVVIPEGVTAIDACAFYNCTSLKTVELPDSMQKIDSAVFMLCTSLEGITLPRQVTYISSSCFADCSSLKEISMLGEVTYVSQYAFKNCTSLKEITFPASIQTLYSTAFEGCSALENIEVEEGDHGYVTVDGSLYYVYYYGISPTLELMKYAEGRDETVFVAPENMTTISSNAFDYNSDLTAIVLPVGFKSVAYNAFAGVQSLQEIRYMGTEEQWAEVSISASGNDAFVNATVIFNYGSEE